MKRNEILLTLEYLIDNREVIDNLYELTIA